jgi:hypothetical protein
MKSIDTKKSSAKVLKKYIETQLQIALDKFIGEPITEETKERVRQTIAKYLKEIREATGDSYTFTFSSGTHVLCVDVIEEKDIEQNENTRTNSEECQ